MHHDDNVNNNNHDENNKTMMKTVQWWSNEDISQYTIGLVPTRPEILRALSTYADRANHVCPAGWANGVSSNRIWIPLSMPACLCCFKFILRTSGFQIPVYNHLYSCPNDQYEYHINNGWLGNTSTGRHALVYDEKETGLVLEKQKRQSISCACSYWVNISESLWLCGCAWASKGWPGV